MFCCCYYFVNKSFAFMVIITQDWNFMYVRKCLGMYTVTLFVKKVTCFIKQLDEQKEKFTVGIIRYKFVLIEFVLLCCFWRDYFLRLCEVKMMRWKQNVLITFAVGLMIFIYWTFLFLTRISNLFRNGYKLAAGLGKLAMVLHHRLPTY